MHDAIAIEHLSVPAIAVVTSRFVSAAELMSCTLGQPRYRFAVIEHPISSAGPDELKRKAQAVLSSGVSLLTR